MSMGVYMGIEMPTNCGKCNLFDASHAIGLFSPLGWCRVNGKEIFRLSEKADFCPLVHVPPHGRLIDADALRVSLVFAEKTAEWAVPALRAVLMVIDEMPTIIPASGGNEDE